LAEVEKALTTKIIANVTANYGANHLLNEGRGWNCRTTNCITKEKACNIWMASGLLPSSQISFREATMALCLNSNY
jgi:hypothetical protein